MERGEFITCYAPLGYRLVDGKNLEIVEEEAVTIRWIFKQYLAGHSSERIASELSKRGIKTVSGNEIWCEKTVRKILGNEKYVGDALAQKTYTTSTFPFVRRYNHGETDQYYIEHTHPGIIDREDFQRVQDLLQRRAQRTASLVTQYPLSKKIVCGVCGTLFYRRTSKSGYVTWVCRRHDDRASDCPMGRIPEQEIYSAFVRMYNKLKQNEGIILKPALAQLDDLNAALQRDNPAMLAVSKAIADASEQSYKVTTLQTRGLLDADACTVKLQSIHAQITELRRERRHLLQNEDLEDVMETLRQTAGTIHDGPDRLDKFDELLFTDLVEQITAESQARIRFRLRGGIELAEQLREVSR